MKNTMHVCEYWCILIADTVTYNIYTTQIWLVNIK